METLRNLSIMQKVSLAFAAGVLVGAGGYYLLDRTPVSNQSAKSKTEVVSTSTTSKQQETTSGGMVSTPASETSGSTGVSSQSSVSTPNPVTVPDTNAIAVDNQPAGTSVQINMVTFSQTGWVAIREDRNGMLGNVLGAARFEPGIHLGSVELLRQTEAGKIYHAVLYADNGDKMFDLKTDAPMQNAGSAIILATFKAQ